MGKKALRLISVILAALLAISFIWVFGSTLLFHGIAAPARSDDPRLANFTNWPTLYEELGGDNNYVVPLSYIKGLSTRFTEASGKTVVTFETGQVTVSVEGLPALEDSSAYELLLVDNKASPENSAALDTGPNGDEVISLGLLDVQGTIAVLEKDLDAERLRQFEVDMVMVRLVGPNLPEEFIIGGLTNLFYKWNRMAGLKGAEPRGLGWLVRKLSPPMVAFAAGRASQANRQLSQLVEQGEQLFFNETFDGNGRTCGTCHRSENSFTIDPSFIATLPNTDLLFIAEFTPALAKLENPTLMRGPRGLILENIDGFNQPPVFRASPPMINLSFTGPYGLSAEFATISAFDIGAVAQHFTKNTGGNPDNITRGLPV